LSETARPSEITKWGF